jgi:hypothetical protein
MLYEEEYYVFDVFTFITISTGSTTIEDYYT